MVRGSSCSVMVFESNTGCMTVCGNNAIISINIWGGVPQRNSSPSMRAILAKCSMQLRPFLLTSANMQVRILLLMLISSLVAVGVLVSNLSFTICVIDATYPFLSAHRNEF